MWVSLCIGRQTAVGYLLGLCAFALFFISDYNDWRLGQQRWKLCFPLGGLLLAVGTLLQCRLKVSVLTDGGRILGFLLGALFLFLLIYTLFFALPVEASYARPGEKRSVCTTGVYALCRHPGVLWFAGLYVCLWAAAGLPLRNAVTYCLLNVLLVLFEDRCVFPDKLEGYVTYRTTTPFLIPNRKSIRACMKTL